MAALPLLLSEFALVIDMAPLMLTSRVLFSALTSSLLAVSSPCTIAEVMSALVFWRMRLMVTLPDTATPNEGWLIGPESLCGASLLPSSPLALSK